MTCMARGGSRHVKHHLGIQGRLGFQVRVVNSLESLEQVQRKILNLSGGEPMMHYNPNRHNSKYRHGLILPAIIQLVPYHHHMNSGVW